MISKSEEKSEGRDKLDQEVDHFNDFIHSSMLIDMQTPNGTHTWSNRRTGKHHIASKLDRFLTSDNAIHLGGDISACILPYSGSDHWPIELQWQRPGSTTRRPFRFEASWLTHPTFKDFIRQNWNNSPPTEGSKMFQFQQKLKFLKFQLKNWNKEIFGNIFKAQQHLNQQMKDLQQQIITDGYKEEFMEQEKYLRNQIEERNKQDSEFIF